MLTFITPYLLLNQSSSALSHQNHAVAFRRIGWIFFGLIFLQGKSTLAKGMTNPMPIIEVNTPHTVLHAGGVYSDPVPSSENFDEVTLTGSTGFSLGSSPRVIGDWTFQLIDPIGNNDAGSYVDVTNSTGVSHLTDDGNDKALNMNGTFNLATAAVIKTSSGLAFSLTSFNIENGGASSPNYRVVGYLGGTSVITQDFTAKQYNQSGPYVISLSDSKWQNIDEFRIVRQDGSADVSFYIDDIVVGAAVSTPTTTTISSISRTTTSPTNATSVNYTVTFGASVTGLTKSNFSLTASGTTGAAVGTITGSGTTYTVPVNTGTGDGNITLNLANSTGISPGISTTLPFAGQVYAIDKTPPSLSISAPSSTTTAIGPVSYTVTYTDVHTIISSLSSLDLTLNQTGTATGTVAVSGSGTSYTVTISAITGSGTLGISIKSGTAKDAAGNLTSASNASSTFNVTQPASPVISNLNGDEDTFIEGDSPIFIDAGSNTTVTDADSPDFNGGNLTASITGNRQSGEDIVGVRVTGQFSVSGGIIYFETNPIGTITPGTGTNDFVVNFNTSDATPAAIQALIRALTYYNSNHSDPSTLDRTVSITVNDGDGQTSAVSNVTISVTGVNDAPTLSTTGSTSTFTEGGTAVPLFSSTAISTIESGQKIIEVDLSVSGISDGADEILNIDGVEVELTDAKTGTTTNGLLYLVAVSGGDATVKLTSGSGVSSSIMTGVVNGLSYTNTSDPPTTSKRTITLTFIQDDGGTANGGVEFTNLSISATVNVVAANEAPVVTTSGGITAFTQGNNVPSTPVVIDGVVTLSDVDNTTFPSATVAITGNFRNDQDILAFTNDGTTMGDITGSYNGATGVLSLSSATGATIAAWESALRSITYDNDSQNPNTSNRTIAFVVSDGSSSSTSSTKSVSVTAVNHLPVITSNGGGSTASVNVSENTTAVTTVTATDADAGTTLTYSVTGGADAALFKVNSNTGQLEFKAAPDFEKPSDIGKDNTYEVTVGVSDGSQTVEQAITVTVTDVNDNTPAITSEGGGYSATVIMVENSTAVTTVKAKDADAGTTIIYSIVGGIDQGLFSINGSSGVLVMKSAADFENPSDADGDGNYEVTVRASDGLNHMDQALTVSVINASNHITITSNGGGSTASISIAENTKAVATVTATVTDPGNSISYSLSGGADHNLFSIDAITGVLTFINAPDYDNPTDADINNTYEVTVRAFVGTVADEQALSVTVTDADVVSVTLMRFTAIAEKNSAKLQWSTATETNNKAFIISRSTDGQLFTEIGKVAGAGNSALQRDYVFFDKSPTNGINYYLLQQVDLDGRVTSHGIRKVVFSIAGLIKLYPIPVRDFLRIEFPAANYHRIELVDNNGKVLQAYQLSIVDNQRAIQLNGLPSGIYYIRLIGSENGKMEVRKIVKE